MVDRVSEAIGRVARAAPGLFNANFKQFKEGASEAIRDAGRKA